jgi:hypothetical protein
MNVLRCTSLSCLSTALLAQLPTDAAIAWELPASPIPAVSYAIADVLGAGSTIAWFLGLDRQQSASVGVVLPFELTVLGAASCFLTIDPALGLAGLSSVGGVAGLALPIPASPGLAGLELFAQAFVPDLGIQPLGFAATSGLALRIR